jgi:hypothetical protein
MRLGADVNVELGLSATAQISLGSAAVRGLYGVSSGAIRLAADGYGKSSVFKFTISTNQTDANLRTLAINAGWDQSSAVEATVSSGVYITGSSTGTAALTVSGSWPKGLTFTNNGLILGRGGTGGNGGSSGGRQTNTAGGTGGPAMSLSNNITINNLGTIGGGGGGGGGGGASAVIGASGGGGGGGANFGPGGSRGSQAGGAVNSQNGSPGTQTAGGSGGAGGGDGRPNTPGGRGGNGGGLGAAGAGGSRSADNTYPGSGGGAAGKAINLNGFTATFITTGTIFGAIS